MNIKHAIKKSILISRYNQKNKYYKNATVESKIHALKMYLIFDCYLYSSHNGS